MFKYIILGLILINIQLYAKENFPLKNIKVGMKAIGKTVITGVKIEEFDVEILGILKNSKINDSLIINGNSILVRVSGDVINKSGGIAAGMSGSPVYIDNKLIGAISSGWIMTDHTVGMVTPIEDMMKLMDYPKVYPELGKLELKKPIYLNGKKILGVCFNKNIPGFLKMNKVKTPLIVSGLNKRNIDRLKNKMNLSEVVPFNNINKVKTKGNLQEGSAISVQLARGDINISTIGTLTYLHKDQILAFGHSFMKKGNANYFLSEAYIYHCFSSVNMPFKIGVPTKLCGMVVQDREQGIYGVLNKFPLVVPFMITVEDKDIKINKKVNIQIINNNDVISTLSDSLLVQAVDGVLNRVGSGTSKVKFEIEYETGDFKNYSYSRENIFYENDDIANTSATEFGEMLKNIIENDFEKVRIKKINVNVILTKERKTAILTDVMIDRKEITPGDVLSLIIKLKPYRKKEFSKKINISFNKNIDVKNCKMIVKAGESVEIESKDNKKKYNSETNFDEFMHSFMKRSKNNEIIISFYDTSNIDVEKVLLEKRLLFPYVVEGYFDYDFKIVSQYAVKE